MDDKKKILIIDDEKSILESLKILLKLEGYDIYTAESANSAKKLLDGNRFNLIISDVKMPESSGLDFIKYFREENKGIGSAYKYLPIILMTAYSDAKTGVEAIKLGAYDYVSKPLDNDEFKLIVKRALDYFSAYEELNCFRASMPASGGIKGGSRAVKNVLSEISRVSANFNNMLITGESGTGKELAARLVHEIYSGGCGGRKDVPFVPVNIAAIPENLVESELFGYTRGAFTGAEADKTGLIKYADGGILFLDEIGDLPPQVQVKLLRVLQEKAYRRLGSNREESVRLKIIAATNADLDALIKEGKFREDLYYRLNSVQIKMPPLRGHMDDIPALAAHFARKFCGGFQALSPDAMAALMDYDYPGNVRELENIIERACLYCRGADGHAAAGEAAGEIGIECLPDYILKPGYGKFISAGGLGGEGYISEITRIFDAVNAASGLSLPDFIDAVERSIAANRIGKRDSRLEAAKSLGLSLRSLRYILSKKQ